MRRAIASFMLLVFSAFLCTPLLAISSNLQNDLPACCRRAGKHQCMLRMMESDPGSREASTSPEKCPFFPHTWQPTLLQNHAMAPSPAGALYAGLQSHPACHAQSEAQRRISFDRSRQKRGPPAAVIAS
jgi:hypothetical protein